MDFFFVDAVVVVFSLYIRIFLFNDRIFVLVCNWIDATTELVLLACVSFVPAILSLDPAVIVAFVVTLTQRASELDMHTETGRKTHEPARWCPEMFAPSNGQSETRREAEKDIVLALQFLFFHFFFDIYLFVISLACFEWEQYCVENTVETMHISHRTLCAQMMRKMGKRMRLVMLSRQFVRFGRRFGCERTCDEMRFTQQCGRAEHSTKWMHEENSAERRTCTQNDAENVDDRQTQQANSA